MTALDDTRQDLNAAAGALALAASTAGTDAALAAVMNEPIGTADAAVYDALDALKAYEATLPLPLVAGLSTTNMKPLNGVTNLVCNVHWRQLQSTLDGSITPNNPIDQALTVAYPHPFRVRLNFGRYSPPFAYDLAGSVSVYDRNDGVSATVPCWWKTNLIDAQSRFVAQLAEKYDGLISAIFVATPMTIYAEPFMRHTNDMQTRANLVAAGYTPALDQASYLAAFDMFAVFKRTRLAISYNPWQYVKPDGSYGVDNGFTLEMIEEFRRRYPSAIHQNNSIRLPALGGSYPEMYNAMSASPPLSFQTATMARVGNLPSTLDWAVAAGAHLVELNVGWQTLLTPNQVASYDAALKANAAA